jgi:MFS family permease
MDGTDKGQALGIVFAFATLPFLLFAVPFGALVDRFDRRRAMIAADLGRAALVGTLAVSLVHAPDSLSLTRLCAIAFFMNTFTTVFNPARDALIPTLVPEKDLFRANALVQSAQQLGPVIGWVMAAGVIAAIGRAHLFSIDAISFAVSAGLLVLLATPPRHASQRKVAASPAYWTDLREGLRDTWKNRPVRNLLVITFCNNLFIMGPAVVASATLINVEWGLSDNHYVGFEVSFALGMLTGTVVSLQLKRFLPSAQILVLGLLWDGLTFVAFSFVPNFPVAVVVIFFHAIGIPLITVSRTALCQTAAPARYHGRTFALVGLTVSGAMALSLSVSGFAVDLYGAMPLFLVAGIGGTITGLWTLTLRDLFPR